jgi:hypothetical protein
MELRDVLAITQLVLTLIFVPGLKLIFQLSKRLYQQEFYMRMVCRQLNIPIDP